MLASWHSFIAIFIHCYGYVDKYMLTNILRGF